MNETKTKHTRGSGLVYLPDSSQVVRVPRIRVWVLDYMSKIFDLNMKSLDNMIASVPNGVYTDYVYGGLLVRTKFDDSDRYHDRSRTK